MNNHADQVFVYSETMATNMTDHALRQSYSDFEECFLDLSLLHRLTVDEMDLKSNIRSVSSRTPIVELCRELLRKMITGFPVVNERGQLVGVISSTDISSAVARPELLERMCELTAGDLMTKYAVTATPNSSLAEILHLMLAFRLHRIVIVDGDLKPIGLVTALDAVKMLGSLLRELKEVSVESDGTLESRS